jgi:hypothetical protein
MIRMDHLHGYLTDGQTTGTTRRGPNVKEGL